MVKKFSGILPAAIFLIFIIGVGYLIWFRPVDVDPTPTVDTPELATPTPVSLSTSTSTVRIAKVTSALLTPTPVLLSTPTSTVKIAMATPGQTVVLTTQAVSATLTPTATPTLTPRPTPTRTVVTPSQITGIVIPENLNVRAGPGLQYGYVGAVYAGDEVVILRRTSLRNWLEVKTLDNKQGWVGAGFIGDIEGDLTLVPLVMVTPLPPPPTAVPERVISLDPDGPSIAEGLGPTQERWYSFVETDKVSIFVLMFRPNFEGVHISLLDQDDTQQWRIVGVGSIPASDRDGDLNSGELVWRGGPLVVGETYYLHLVNNSREPIEYCLIPRDEYPWGC